MIKVIYTDNTIDLFNSERDFHTTVGYRLKHGLPAVKTVEC